MDNFEYISSRIQCPDVEKENAFAIVQRICTYAEKARTEGPLALEPLLDKEPDAFLQDSLRRLVDAESPNELQEAMQIHILAANASGSRFLELMVIADGIYEMAKNMRPRTLLSRLSEWFGETYRNRFAEELAKLEAEEEQHARDAHAKQEAQTAQIQTVKPKEKEQTHPEIPVESSILPQNSDTPESLTKEKADTQQPIGPTANTSQQASIAAFHQLGSCGFDSIKRLLQDVDDKVLAAALKGVDKPLFSLFWSALPKERCQKLLENMSETYPIHTNDIEEAQSKILDIAKKLEAKQEISLNFPNGELKAPHWEVIL